MAESISILHGRKPRRTPDGPAAREAPEPHGRQIRRETMKAILRTYYSESFYSDKIVEVRDERAFSDPYGEAVPFSVGSNQRILPGDKVPFTVIPILLVIEGGDTGKAEALAAQLLESLRSAHRRMEQSGDTPEVHAFLDEGLPNYSVYLNPSDEDFPVSLTDERLTPAKGS